MDELRLAWMLSKRDLTNRYANSYAGFFWNIGVPLFNALIMAVVFSALMGGKIEMDSGKVPFVLYYFVPFSLWMLFSEVLVRSTGILKEYAYLVNKISFPYWVLPLVPFLSAILAQIIIIMMVMVLAYHLNFPISETPYVFLIVWLITVVLTAGFAYAIAAVSVYLPDMGQLVPLVINVWFWLTPILYPASLVKEHAPQWLSILVVEINPFTHIAEFSRIAILGNGDYPIFYIGILAGVALAVLIFGVFIFTKLKSGFADVL